MKPVATPVLFFAFANDREEQARYLRNLPEEARHVQKILAAAEARGHCELVVRQNATASDILDIFQDPRYRDRIALFHFGGHANGYQLLVETADGRAIAANAGGLARFLAQQRGLQLIFLNACATEGQVMDLLDAGVPAVIATDQAVEDATATAFAARFYRGLDGGATFETAFQEARAAMQMQGDPYLPRTAAVRHIGAAEEDGSDRIPWRLHYRPGAEAVAGWSLPLAARDPLFGLPDLPSLDLPDKPYCYLDWYRRDDAEIFFGRGQEIRKIYDCVTAVGSPPIVLFYGQSGVGKSSLLAAGLLPRLEASHSVRYTRRDQARGLLGTLAAALKSSPGDDLSAVWRTSEAEASRPLVVVLDQVEEVFTRPHPQQPGEMSAFLAGLEHLFGDASRRPQGRLILSFRKEWLPEIKERLVEGKLPRGELFLERLGRQGIVEVVAGPQSTPRLRAHYGLTVADGLPGLIADDLLADRESPVAPMLAILLADMWDAAKARHYDSPHFDPDLYHDLRSRGLSLDDFLGRQLQTLHTRQSEAVDSGLVLDLLAYHTTPLGTAEQRTLADLKLTYQHRQDVLPDLAQECRDLYLLVDPSQNQPGSPPASRLTHDTLGPHVRKRFDESDAPGQRAWRILVSRRLEWQAGQTGSPIEGGDLHTVEKGLLGMRGLSEDEARLLATSRQVAATRRRNQLLLRIVLGTLLLIVTGVALQATLYPALLMQYARWTGYPVVISDLGVKFEAYEVTNQRYQQCVNARVCSPPSIQLSSYHLTEHPYLPITGVDALQAASFCKWIYRRLPTEDEWKHVATLGGTSQWPWGDDKPSSRLANLCYSRCESLSGTTHQVGSLSDGAEGGIYDLIGNVFEWTGTEMGDDRLHGIEWLDADPAKVPLRLVVVGGSYVSFAGGALVTSRESATPSKYTGFRCVESITAE